MGSGYVVSSIVTWRSCIASSSALCTFAGARLILVGQHEVREQRPPCAATNVPSFWL